MTGRENAKKAYGYFKKADKFVPGYKDAIAKSDQAYESAIVNVIINPIQDNSYYFNSSWGNTGYNFSNEHYPFLPASLYKNVQDTCSYLYRLGLLPVFVENIHC